jgi:hypothetical protein
MIFETPRETNVRKICLTVCGFKNTLETTKTLQFKVFLSFVSLSHA